MIALTSRRTRSVPLSSQLQMGVTSVDLTDGKRVTVLSCELNPTSPMAHAQHSRNAGEVLCEKRNNTRGLLRVVVAWLPQIAEDGEDAR